MNNKKRNKYEKNELMPLPLEKSELLIENIHNLKNCLNLYRKEIQEKNKYINDLKSNLNFYDCVLRNINIVWRIFNDDLLNLIDKSKEDNNNVSIESPYYNIEEFLTIFLKYVSENDLDNENEEFLIKTFSNYDDNSNSIHIKTNKIKLDDLSNDNSIKNEKGENLENLADLLKNNKKDIHNEHVRDMLVKESNNEDSKDNIVKMVNKEENKKNTNEICSEEEKEKLEKTINDDELGYIKKEIVNNKDFSKTNQAEIDENIINSNKRNSLNDVNVAKRICLNSRDNLFFENNESQSFCLHNDLTDNKRKEKDKVVNTKKKKEKNENMNDVCKDNFEEKLQNFFLENLRNTLSFINKIIDLKNINLNYNLEYIRKIKYEKSFYMEKYADEKKKNNELQNNCESLKIEIDRLEKKSSSLIFKLYKEDICKNILEEKIDKNEDIMNYSKVENKESNKMTSDNCYDLNTCDKDAHLVKNDNFVNDNNNNNNNSNDNSYENNNNGNNNNVESKLFLNLEKIITKEKIIQSEPFKNLINESTEIYNKLKEKENEIIILKKEIIKMENLRDEEFENLLNETIRDKKSLTNKIKELEVDLATYKLDKEKIESKIKVMEYEIGVLKNIEKKQTMQLQQKESEILKMKLQLDKFKISENNLRDKVAFLEKEKDDLLNSTKSLEENLETTKKSILNNSDYNIIINEDDYNKNIDLYEKKDMHRYEEKQGNENMKKEEKSILKNHIDNKNKNENNIELQKNMKNVDDYILKYDELLLENNNLKKKLEKKKHVEEELINLKKNYDAISEEIEEITKEFEKKQEQVDEMITQIKNKELESLEKYNNKVNKAYVEEKLKQLESSYQDKMSCINSIYEKYEKFVNLYLTLFFHARKNAVISDSAREEQMSIFIKLKQKYEYIFQKKNEISNILKNVYDCNRKLIEQCKTLHKENENLQNTLSNQINISKDISKKDNHLLVEENNELRRRLICSVCMENFRNYIIIKCGHIYCENCIFNNIKTRNRKCPQCKIPFDKKDLQKIFLD
ncbi:trophozoite exported protein 1, putative [Plasmodium gallinaceum]|uniref:E3 ubiquitin protein ligase n=1 Tax=Plasmodium gallinaceum TaxID=5849 RepID=A0A1J1GMF4_PLAGA|nr:trophozoite exported protein 1, putative [Plasmodium gallinaceum]CRG93614.1 trophozoite exported protein 1, putative [Plasmodium gallinaceum]